MAESVQAQEARRLYDHRGARYDDSWHPTFARTLASMADIQPGEQVLDLACGTGLVTFVAAARVGSSGAAIGVDVSEGMLHVAEVKKERLGQEAAHVELHVHDIADLEGFPDIRGRTFDIITCASALVFLRDAAAAVEQWARHLKPGGKLVVDVPHPQNMIASAMLEGIGQQLGVPMPYNRSWVKGQESLRELLEAAGLKVEREEFVEQAGYGKQFYDVDEAEDRFVSQLMTESGRDFRKPTERREKALGLFKEEWRKAAERDNGKVVEIDGVFVAVARKPAGY